MRERGGKEEAEAGNCVPGSVRGKVLPVSGYLSTGSRATPWALSAADAPAPGSLGAEGPCLQRAGHRSFLFLEQQFLTILGSWISREIRKAL